MGEVINTTQYLDLVGLKKYDGLIKLFIEKGDKELADRIADLTAKIGDLDLDGSDGTLADIVNDIYESINALGQKDAELEGDIKDIIGEVSESVDLMTLAEVSAKLKALEDANLVNRVSVLEGTIDDLKNLGGENGLVNVVDKVNANATAIATLTGDETVDGSVKKAAADATAAAIADAAEKYQVKGDYETAGAAAAAQAAAEATAAADATSKAAAAEAAAKTYADGLVKDEEGNVKFDAVGSAAAAQAAAEATAAADATSKANAAQAAAEATASADATNKANAAESAAKTYADELVKDAEGNVKFDAAGSAADALEDAKEYAEKLTNIYDAAGSAADALEDAKEYADGLAGNYDASGSAAAAQEAAIAAAATDASEKAASALKDAKDYVDAIAHASDVKYEGGYINLYDAAGQKIGAGFDASPFVVDGMLDTVDFVKDESGNATSTLRFTFNVDTEGSEDNKKTIDVDFAKYVDVYHADDSSIELNSETNTFSVKEVAATKTKTVDAIPVAGGPLESLLKGAGITEIAAGSSIEDILFSLICKELWAKTLTFSEGTVSSSIAQPSFTLSNSGGTVEVGTKCTLSEITMSAATPSVSKNRTYSGFTYGYSAENDNTQDSTDTSITAGVDVEPALNEGNYTMTRDYTQFNGATDDSATANADASQVKLDGAELTVSYVGTNSVKVSVGGPTASATFAAMPVYYACSNLKKTKDATKDSEGQYKSEAKDAKKVTSSAASNSKTLSVTGARAYWMGSVKNAIASIDSVDSAFVRAAGESETDHVTKTLGATPVTTVKATSGDASVIIATQKEITKITSENQINADVFGNFSHKSVTIEGANGFTGIAYHVYVWTPANVFAKDDTLTITYK